MNLHRPWHISLFTLGMFTQVLIVKAGGFFGGEMRFAQTQENTYLLEAHVYSALQSPGDLPELLIDCGDGTSTLAPRVEILDAPTAPCGSRWSVYRVSHTYPGPGTYVASFSIYNRRGGVINIPNSIAQATCIEAVIVVDALLALNSSIRFETSQPTTSMVWNTLVHDPGAVDADGDSLHFELVAPNGLGCVPITGYQQPLGTNFTWLNPANGTFHWDYPPYTGEWNLTIRGSEYRNGQLIGQVTRDMTICAQPFEVGLAETTSSTAFPIRPTIATDQLWIDAPGTWTVEVLDASGRTVIHGMQAGNGSPLDLNGINAGTYLLRAVGTDGTRRTARFVKTR